jgi:hypothetical protein
MHVKGSQLEYEVATQEMSPEIRGFVDLRTFPFKIRINSKSITARKLVSIVHEMLHIAAHLYKIPLSHHDLHSLAVFITTEMMPAMDKLRGKEYLRDQRNDREAAPGGIGERAADPTPPSTY